MNLTSVIITSSETFSLILLINEVSVIIAISKTWRNDRSINLNPFRPHALFFYDDRCLQNKEIIIITFSTCLLGLSADN